MIDFLRRFQQPVMITLTVVVIIAFVILYGGPGTRLDRLGADSAAKMYGRNVHAAEVGAVSRQFQVCQSLGMIDVLIHLSGNARTMQDAIESYTWNTMVLRHQAAKLGILPTDVEVAEAIKALPMFQIGGKYDHGRYTLALQAILAPRGMNALHLEEIIRDSLRLNAIRNVLSASSAPSPDELQEAYANQFQKVEVQLARIAREPVANSITLTDDEIKQAFEARKDGLKTPEKRKVEFVHFPLPKPEKEGQRPAVEAMQKVVDRSADFAAALTEPGAVFGEVAKKFEMEVKASALFASGDRLEEFSNQPRISTAAFQLTEEKPFSDTLGTPQGYFVMHLTEVEKARPKTLEESKEQLAESLKSDKTREILSLKASEARKKIEEGLKSGKSFTAVVEEAGLKAEAPEPFNRSESKLAGADSALIQARAMELKEGELSAPVEGVEGTILVHLVKKVPFESKDIEAHREKLAPMLETARVDGLLGEWIERQRAASGLQISSRMATR
jgi:hypothetical protein